MSLKELAVEYRKVRSERTEWEEQVKLLKEREEELKRSILMEMSSMGVRTAVLPEVGRLTMKESVRYEIADIESFMGYGFERMVEAMEQGRPLSDALLFQKRAAASMLDEIVDDIDDADKKDAFLATRGIRRRIEPTLSFTKN